MSFVGGGCGDYVQDTTYRYVGAGAGEFTVAAPKKSNYACFFIGSSVAVVALVIVLVLVLLPGPISTTTLPPSPPEVCLIWGDPHIQTFDNSRADFFGEGIKWIVKSDRVHIQGRYKATPFTNGLAATNSVAVGGPFLNGHVLKVGPMENGQITWDNQPILGAFGTFDAAGLGTINYNDQGELVDEAQSHLQRHIVHMTLPNNVQVQVMRWANHINLRITMSSVPGQDGHCGNFNGNPGDDTTDQIRARIGLGVPQGESLFRAYQPAVPGQRKTVDECEAGKRAAATQSCTAAGHTGANLDGCIFDACFAGPQYVNEGY
jgi:hypothetical protein